MRLPLDMLLAPLGALHLLGVAAHLANGGGPALAAEGLRLAALEPDRRGAALGAGLAALESDRGAALHVRLAALEARRAALASTLRCGRLR